MLQFHQRENLTLKYEISSPSKKLQLLWVLPYIVTVVLNIKPSIKYCLHNYAMNDDSSNVSKKGPSLAQEE